jgi:hypothetical protein
MESIKKGRSYLKWSDQMDKAMLDVFVEHYNKGDRAQNGWKPHVYTAAVKNVRQKCESEVTKENVISRSKTFDKHYVTVNKMLCQSGFGWDCDNNMISVDSEDVWDNYVKVNVTCLHGTLLDLVSVVSLFRYDTMSCFWCLLCLLMYSMCLHVYIPISIACYFVVYWFFSSYVHFQFVTC